MQLSAPILSLFDEEKIEFEISRRQNERAFKTLKEKSMAHLLAEDPNNDNTIKKIESVQNLKFIDKSIWKNIK